ncbi:MAG: pilus assembly protein [Chloroflexi bacterium]|nr:pilus assembly protein [Chloroflexota bacterium]
MGRGGSGQALVEFAFVLLFAMISFLLLLDIGRFFFEYNAMRGGLLMGSVQMQESNNYKGYSTCDTKKAAVEQVLRDASGLGTSPSTDLYGNTLPTGEQESLTFTPSSCGTSARTGLFSACNSYTLTWSRPFLPVAPFARQLLGLGGMSLTLTAEIKSQHNNSPGGTAC